MGSSGYAMAIRAIIGKSGSSRATSAAGDLADGRWQRPANRNLFRHADHSWREARLRRCLACRARLPGRQDVMPNKMLIDASHPEETRVVVVRGNRIEEFDFESQDKKQLKGNIYLAASRASNLRSRPPLSSMAAIVTVFWRSVKSTPTITRSLSPTGRRCCAPKPRRPKPRTMRRAKREERSDRGNRRRRRGRQAPPRRQRTADEALPDAGRRGDGRRQPVGRQRRACRSRADRGSRRAEHGEAAFAPTRRSRPITAAEEPPPTAQRSDEGPLGPVPAAPKRQRPFSPRSKPRSSPRRPRRAAADSEAPVEPVTGGRRGRQRHASPTTTRSNRSAPRMRSRKSAAAASRCAATTRSRKSSSAARSCWSRSSRKSAATRARR